MTKEKIHPWKPIIDSTEKANYLDKLSEIASALAAEIKNIPTNEVALFNGKTGILLFLFYYSRLIQNQEYYDLAVELLYDVMEHPYGNYGIHTFAMGQSGILWTIEHLVKQQFIEMDTDESLGEIIPVIYKTMNLDIKVNHYDYMHGAIGNGLYFLERADKPQYRQYVEELVDALEDMSMKNPDGSIKWLSIIDNTKKTKGFNIAMSHGISSIVNFLARVSEAGIRKEKTAMLLDGAVKYILQQRLEQNDKEKKYRSIFPKLALETEPPDNSRLAWCYGDLGIGFALWQAGCLKQEETWKQVAVDILIHSAGRRNLEENHVSDACLCHGTAGIAHIFNRTYQDTGNPLFKDASLYWWQKTLDMAKYKDGLAGYKSRSSFHTAEVYLNNTGFLEGLSGTGLAILAAVSDMEPKWDRALLLS